MIELRKIYSAWQYSEKSLKKSTSLGDILVTLLINCREYYGRVGMDFPSLTIHFNNNVLSLDCGLAFGNLDNDEEVIKYVTNWYTEISKETK